MNAVGRDVLAEIDRAERLFAEREARIQAFLPEADRFGRLRREAAVLGERYPDAAQRPPLYGILAGVKDCLHADGFETRVGSRLPPEELAGDEAAAVTALKAAGALILGKTVTTEFTYFAPGPTTNPHHPEHTPGGSSSGSAAAVGGGLCRLALGTQTIGSVGRPAAFCGAVGYKASYDRIPTSGAVYLAKSLDHVGFFSDDMALAVTAASVLVSGWAPGDRPPARPVLGVPVGPYLEQADADGLEHFQAVCQTLQAAEFDVRHVAVMDAVMMEDFAAVRERHNLLVAGEAARHHTGRFDRHEDVYRPQTAELIRRGRTIGDDDLAALQRGCLELRRHLVEAMEAHGIDLWISPPARGAAPRGLDSTGDPVMNLPWTQSGLPTLVLPAGSNAEGLPLGLQLTGRFGVDEDVLAWGVDVDRALRKGETA